MSGRRGGRSGGRSGGGGLPREVQVSKKISWLLRHGAVQEGLKLGEGGYVNVADALNTRALKSLHVTFDELQSVVASNDKQRFSLIPAPTLSQPSNTIIPTDNSATQTTDPTTPTISPQNDLSVPLPSSPSDYLIRANQGHSLNVSTTGLLTPITASNLPALCIHGTTHSAWLLILDSGGLKPMGRTHIHFASGLPKGLKPLEDEAEDQNQNAATSENGTLGQTNQNQGEKESANGGEVGVISGMRASSSILIYVDVERAIREGIEFFVSENGVLLSAGEKDSGLVPLRVFWKVEERKEGLGVLVRDGKVVQEAPERWRAKGKGGGRGGRGGRGRGRGRGG
ncbi:MAG: hypothetical protein M1820_004018 [Bogoriella megaspora]|nr:MAG: hypothetical protein M1820_004018 [Bogoriella megaspora]